MLWTIWTSPIYGLWDWRWDDSRTLKWTRCCDIVTLLKKSSFRRPEIYYVTCLDILDTMFTLKKNKKCFELNCNCVACQKPSDDEPPAGDGIASQQLWVSDWMLWTEKRQHNLYFMTHHLIEGQSIISWITSKNMMFSNLDTLSCRMLRVTFVYIFTRI